MSEEIRIQTKPLSEMVVINNGIDYKKNPKGNEEIPIYGTGGIIGYTNIALNEGPAVLTGRKGSINRPFYLEGKFWNVDTIFCLKPIGANNAKWLYYSILNVDMTKLNEATGVPSITSKSLYRLKIYYFEPDKQREIAHILTTCDTVIEQTQSAIAKYKAIKQGLLHDLFTRGLDANGRLRPCYEDAPKFYKESELGMIPKEWAVKRLGDWCIVNPKTSELPESFVYIDLESVEDGKLKHENYVSKKDAPSRAQRILAKHDVLYQMVRPYQKNNLYFNNNNENIKYVASTGYAQLRTKEYSLFLFYILHTDWFVNEVLIRCTGSNYPAINSSELQSIYVAVPSGIEQEEIGERLNSIDNKIKTEETLLQKYQSIKRGLMGDLLGGVKRCVCRDAMHGVSTNAPTTHPQPQTQKNKLP